MPTEPARGPGRPPYASPQDRRDVRVVVQVTAAQKAAWEAEARAQGVTLSEMIRARMDS